MITQDVVCKSLLIPVDLRIEGFRLMVNVLLPPSMINLDTITFGWRLEDTRYFGDRYYNINTCHGCENEEDCVYEILRSENLGCSEYFPIRGDKVNE